MGYRAHPGGPGRTGVGGGAEPDEGLAADPRRRDGVERVAAPAGVARPAGQGAHGRTARRSRRVTVAALLLVSALVVAPAPFLARTVQASPTYGAPTYGAPTYGAALAATAPRAPDVASLRPRVVWKPIPYGDRRRSQMAAYSNRHYGHWTWRLRGPVAVVQHYTTGTTWQGAWNTFAANSPHLSEDPCT